MFARELAGETPALPGKRVERSILNGHAQNAGGNPGRRLAAPTSRGFGFELNLHDLGERHHDFLFPRAEAGLHVHFVGGDARDALDDQYWRAPFSR